MLRRHPSPATIIATAALFIAISGTAYAATGGTFILGKANSATSVSTLSNSKGTALSLSSKAGTPPLSVNNGTQVPNLNASLLDGNSSSAFVQGNSKFKTAQLTLSGSNSQLIVGNDTDLLYLDGACDPSGAGSGEETYLENYTGSDGDFGFQAFNTGTPSDFGSFSNNSSLTLTTGIGSPVMVTGEVVAGSNMASFVVFATYAPGTPDVCSWSAQFFYK